MSEVLIYIWKYNLHTNIKMDNFDIAVCLPINIKIQ
jgi:hypothetical protein